MPRTFTIPLVSGGTAELTLEQCRAALSAAHATAMTHAIKRADYVERAKRLVDVPAFKQTSANRIEVLDSEADVQMIDPESDDWGATGAGAWVSARIWVHDHDEFCACDTSRERST